MTDGTATYSVTNVENEILSVVAAMPPGSVADAEPDLVDASSYGGGSLKVQSEPLTVVQADGEKVRDVAQQALYSYACEPGQESPLDDGKAVAMTQAAQQAVPQRDLAVTKNPEKRRSSAFPVVMVPLLALAFAGNLFPSSIGQALPSLSSIPASLLVLIIVGLVIGWKVGALPALLFTDPDQPAEALTAQRREAQRRRSSSSRSHGSGSGGRSGRSSSSRGGGGGGGSRSRSR